MELNIYLEKLLEPPLGRDDDNKILLFREIESLEEFDKIPNEARGIIWNKKLFMVNVASYSEESIHNSLMKWLSSHEPGFDVNFIHGNNDIKQAKDYLCVQKFKDVLNLGESYTGQFIHDTLKIHTEEHKVVEKQFRSLKVKVPYKIRFM